MRIGNTTASSAGRGNRAVSSVPGGGVADRVPDPDRTKTADRGHLARR